MPIYYQVPLTPDEQTWIVTALRRDADGYDCDSPSDDFLLRARKLRELADRIEINNRSTKESKT